MTTPKETIWDIEPHTLAKHEILRRYLGAWFPILGSFNDRVVYIDGFCGPGRYNNGEPGSPVIALNEALKHQQRLHSRNITFLFIRLYSKQAFKMHKMLENKAISHFDLLFWVESIDERPDRIEHLRHELSLASVPANYKTIALTGFFDNELTRFLNDLEANGGQLAPTFAFIDPFGFKGLPFKLVSRLLQKPRTEVFVNVMADSINRFLEHPDDQTTQHIVELFGTDEVLRIAKATSNRMRRLRLLYQEQLRRYARFVRFFEMRNAQNRANYYLFFASNHPLGHVRMKGIPPKLAPPLESMPATSAAVIGMKVAELLSMPVVM
jgi:three-Cys-motif partner protein